MQSRGDGSAEAVIGCDTVVVLDGVIYGKPADAAAGPQHAAGAGRQDPRGDSAALVVLLPGEERTAVARTEVSFRAMDGRMLDWYVRHRGVARARGRLRDPGCRARRCVGGLSGEYENVVGLPLASLLDLYPRAARRLSGHPPARGRRARRGEADPAVQSGWQPCRAATGVRYTARLVAPR